MRRMGCCGFRRASSGSCLAVFLAVSCSHPGAPPLPAIQTSSFLPSVRSDIDSAYEGARSQPSDATATGRLCRLLDAHDQSEAAAQCYLRASFLDPKDFQWQYNLGVVRMAQSRHTEAATAFRAALALRDYRPATLKLPQCLREADDEEQSMQLFRKLVTDDPGNAEAWYGLGRVQERRQDILTAQQSYQKACDLYQNYGSAHYALALLLQRQGRTAEARQHFTTAEQHKTELPPTNDTVRTEINDLAVGTTALLRRGSI